MIPENTSRTKKKSIKHITTILLIIITISVMINITIAQPAGIEIIFNQTDVISPAPAANIITAGGTFTTMVLGGTFQTPRWKAYVGNVTGNLVLADSNNRTIYDWELTIVSGQIYVTRTENINWGNIMCATEQTILNEQNFLNISETAADSINRTFNDTIHRGFFVGTTQIMESSCRAIATFVENIKQPPSVNATFQEILLQDSNNNIIFTTIIEQARTGFDSNPYDFQLIVPENPTRVQPTTYFFFAEIH